MSEGDYGYGQQTPWDTGSEFQAMAFVVRAMIARLDVMKLCQVVAVHGGGELASPPTVDVLLLVSELDGNGNAVKQGQVNGLPVFRLQGGPWAVVIDPAVDDVGFVSVSDRDISSAKATPGQQVTPGSFRQNAVEDGVYVGGVLNGAPSAYVLLKGDGTLKVSDGHGNVLTTSGSGFSITGNLAVTGNVTATGNITAGQGGADQVGLRTHTHISGGSGDPTGPPSAGT